MNRLAPALLFVAACVTAEPESRGGPLYAGAPVSVNAEARVQVLDNPGFRIGYSDLRRQALWVAFRAASVRDRPRLGPRPEHFSPDARLERPVSSWDYVPRKGKPEYDRGHLAPNYLIGKLYGREAQLATFLMSNVSPQAGRLNQLVWQRLEEAEVDIIAPAMDDLWVITGPVFGARPPSLRKSGIAVPEAFYRIWLDEQAPGTPRMLAFLVPQQVCGTEPLSGFLTSVDEIERRTGLDFHAALADEMETALERASRTAGWKIKKIDRRPPRYADKFESLQCG